MTHTRFNPPQEWKPQIPPTEDDQRLSQTNHSGRSQRRERFRDGRSRRTRGRLRSGNRCRALRRVHAARRSAHPEAGNRSTLHPSRDRRRRARREHWDGTLPRYRHRPRDAVFSGILWASRIHRDVAVDRSKAPTLGNIADQPHLASTARHKVFARSDHWYMMASSKRSRRVDNV